MKLSPTQRETLARMAASTGELFRSRGGFWAPHEPGRDWRETPTWWVGVQTMRSLERLGLVELRPDQHEPEWCATRRLTDAGRKALDTPATGA